jgi:regulator of protease activity HflC (stomatin/prohibitin superfamily)
MFDRLIQFFIDSLKLFQFFAVVRSYEGGVILRFGKFHRMGNLGFNWLWPFSIEELHFDHIVLRSSAVGPQSVTTKDGVNAVISIVVMFRIDDVKQWLLELDHGPTVLDNLACGLMSRKVMDHTWDELVAMDLADELAKIVRRQAKKLGVDIIQVQVTDFTRSLSFRLIGHQLMG